MTRPSVNVPANAAALFVGALLLLALWGAESFSLASIALVVSCAACLGLCLHRLLLAKAWPTAAAVLTFGVAYFPRSWDAVAHGLPQATIPVSAEGTRFALIALAVMMTLATVMTLLLGRLPGLPATGHWVGRVGSAGLSANQLDLAAGLALLGPTIFAFVQGTWSHYGWNEGDQGNVGGLRLDLLYRPLLVANAAIAGTWYTRLRADPLAFSRLGRLVRGGAVLVLATLVFLTQSRRLMVAAALCATLPALVNQVSANYKVLKRAALIVAGLGGLFYLSQQWRHARHQQTRDMSEQVDTMMTETGETSLVEQLEDRLKYLWVDALAYDMGRTPLPLDVTDSAWTQLAGSTPGFLWPGKYDVMPVTCELALMSFDTDLACTPVAESTILGGYRGLVGVMLFWGFSLAVASALSQRGGLPEILLVSIALQVFLGIENSAFPMIFATRQTIQCGALVMLCSYAVRLFIPERASEGSRGNATAHVLG